MLTTEKYLRLAYVQSFFQVDPGFSRILPSLSSSINIWK